VDSGFQFVKIWSNKAQRNSNHLRSFCGRSLQMKILREGKGWGVNGLDNFECMRAGDEQKEAKKYSLNKVRTETE